MVSLMPHSLSEELGLLIRKWEGCGRHDSMAHDHHCDMCRLLADLRVLRLLHAGELDHMPPTPPGPRRGIG